MRWVRCLSVCPGATHRSVSTDPPHPRNPTFASPAPLHVPQPHLARVPGPRGDGGLLHRNAGLPTRAGAHFRVQDHLDQAPVRAHDPPHRRDARLPLGRGPRAKRRDGAARQDGLCPGEARPHPHPVRFFLCVSKKGMRCINLNLTDLLPPPRRTTNTKHQAWPSPGVQRRRLGKGEGRAREARHPIRH